MGNYTSTASSDIELTLVARKPAAGFNTTNNHQLTLVATQGETYGDILERFNTFRSPENQIRALQDEKGKTIEATAKIVTGAPVRLFVN